jgi:muramoyltetrapeptide carboxypeptidase
LNPVFPSKLRSGDQIRIIAPSRSLTSICKTDVEKESYLLAKKRLSDLGLVVTEGEHLWEEDPFECPPAAGRLADLHAAFADPEVKGILTVIGGWNANQILDGIDYALIRANPKVFCGYSDITVLNAAFYAQTGLVSYSGPHISTFGMREGIEFTVSAFRQALMSTAPIVLEPSARWAEDAWFLDQDHRVFQENPGWVVLQEGAAEGRLLGGNLSTLSLLRGTRFMPALEGAVLFLEDLDEVREFDRLLQALLHTPGGEHLSGLVIGRFPSSSKASLARLRFLVESKPALRGIPVVYGLDFGHTTPHLTFPFGGSVHVSARGDSAEITLVNH